MSNIRTARELQEVLWRQGLPEIKVAQVGSVGSYVRGMVRAGQRIHVAQTQNVGDRLRDFGKSIRKSPYLQAALGGVGGAAIGGGIGALSALGTPVDEEEEGGRRKAIMNAALKGALLGGTTGAALPLGTGLMSGKIRIDGSSGLRDAASNALYTGLMKIKGVLIGAGVGAHAFRYHTLPYLADAHKALSAIAERPAKVVSTPASELARRLGGTPPPLVPTPPGSPGIVATFFGAGGKALRAKALELAAAEGREQGKTLGGPMLSLVKVAPKGAIGASVSRGAFRGGLYGLLAYPAAGYGIQRLLEGDL
jgi:hypothetical protein